MAEDIRRPDPDPRLNKQRKLEIVKECKRQWESCLYTSTTLYEWLRCIRFHRKVYIAAPIILGGFASVAVIRESLPVAVIALIAFAAGLFPTLFEALGVQTEVDEVSRLAAEYKSLQDRFRRNAAITALTDIDKAEATLSDLMDRMDIARSSSLIPPERFFLKARERIKAGHYDFEVDGPTLGEA
jgi:hypothetical protein